MSPEEKQHALEKELFDTRTSDTVSALDSAFAFRASHWERHQLVRAGIRLATEVGRACELVCRLPPSTKTWALRKPARSRAELQCGGRFTPCTPGLYVVAVRMYGWERFTEIVAIPDAMLDRIGPRGGRCDRVIVAQAVLNDPACTAANITNCLEGDSPTWIRLHGERPVSFGLYGG